MKTDAEIRLEGMRILFSNMDTVEAEKFISIIQRDRFDYTKWRQTFFEDMTIDEIIQDAKKFAVDFRKIRGTV